jgi:hypothetical protein
MISGAFEHLFSSTSVSFNIEDGTFSFRSETMGSIYIEGTDKRYWTEKAVNRAGFSVAKEKTSTYIILPSEINSYWQLSTESKVTEYKSVYELINALRRVVI